MEKKEKSKLKKILENRPILSGIAMIAIAFTFGLVYATNSTYAVATCPTGWDDEWLDLTGYCVKWTHADTLADARSACNNILTDMGLTVKDPIKDYEGHGGCVCTSDPPEDYPYGCSAKIDPTQLSTSTVPEKPDVWLYATFVKGAHTYSKIKVTVPDSYHTDKKAYLVEVGYSPEYELSVGTDKFIGWAIDSIDNCSDSSKVYSNGKAVYLNKDTNFYACTEPAEDSSGETPPVEDTPSDGGSSSSGTTTKTFTATFNGNGGTVNGKTSDSCTTTGGNNYCNIDGFPTASKSGMNFVGWSKTQSCSGDIYKQWVSLYKNTTLYACYETKDTTKTFTITYNGNGGTIKGKTSDSCTTTGSSCTVTTLPIAERDGYSFNGWGTSNSCTSGKNGSEQITLSNNVTYYACWNAAQTAKPANYYIVKFNLDGGVFADGLTTREEVVADNIVYDGPDINPIKEGYVFDGWYEGNIKYTFAGAISGNINATAKWVENTDTKCEYVCDSGDVYDPSEGKCIKTQKFGGNTFYTTTYTNQKSCSASLLWEEKSTTCAGNCNGEYKCDTDAGFKSDAFRTVNTCQYGSSCSPSGKTQECKDTWYARCFKKYEPKKECVPTTYYTVKFNLNGGIFPDGSTTREEVVANDIRYYGPRTNPVKEGYVFDGWYIGNTKYDFWVVKSDVTLKAKWVKDTSKCEYECNTGDVYDPKFGQCVKIQKFDGGKNYYTSTFNNVISCSSQNQWVETDSKCTGSCNTESCAQGFSSDAYRTVNTCQLNSACSVQGQTKNCEDTWIARCYQTYEAEKICDPDIIDQPQTSDILIGIVWFIGLLGLGYGIYYFKELRNK